MTRLVISALFFAVLGPGTFAATGGAAEEGLPKVLVIYSHEVALPAIREAGLGLREALEAGGRGRAEIFFEHLGVFQPDSDRYLELLSDLYGRKYSDGGIDVVITVGHRALLFVARHGETICPGKPVVFCAVDSRLLDGLPGIDRMSGVTMKVDTSTLELMRDLHPGLSRVLVVSGATEAEERILEGFREQARPFEDEISISYPRDLPFDDLVDRAANLPGNSAILFLSMPLDGEGDSLVPREDFARLAGVSKAPAYGIFDTYIGQGIVGGVIDSFREQGREAGTVAAKILAGETDGSRPVRVTDSRRTVFDWRQLRRWDIGERDLPEGSEILFRGESFIARYRWHIGTVIVFCLFQTILIAVVLIHRRRHIRAEEALGDLREQLYHVSRIKTAGELAAALAHELNQPLMAILSNAQAAGRFLESDEPDLGEVREILREIVEDDRRAGEVIGRLRSFLKKGHLDTETLKVNDIVREVATLVSRDTAMKGIDLGLDLGSHLPDVRGDRVQLQQVVLNLIMNAAESVKRNGGRPPRIDVSSSLGDGTGVTVSVRDNGGGIGGQGEEQLFKPFTTSRQEGLGIGLSISRSIVEGHGGRIWAENNHEGGAVFSFFLPAAEKVMR